MEQQVREALEAASLRVVSLRLECACESPKTSPVHSDPEPGCKWPEEHHPYEETTAEVRVVASP